MHTEETTRKAITLAAAEWWADRFSTPAERVSSGISAVDRVASILPVTDLPTAEQVNAFRSSLAAALYFELTDRRGRADVSMDYRPRQDSLADALEAAGANRDGMFSLPWKTWLTIRGAEIWVGGPSYREQIEPRDDHFDRARHTLWCRVDADGKYDPAIEDGLAEEALEVLRSKTNGPWDSSTGPRWPE